MITVCGSETGFKNGKCLGGETALNNPYSICVDTRNTSNLYIGDRSSIRYVDAAATQTVSLFVGGEFQGFKDGIGEAAKFDAIWGLLCTSSGDRLYLTDYANHRIRMVDTNTRSVTSIAGDSICSTRDDIGLRSSIAYPRKLVFDRSKSIKSESALFITARLTLRRLELKTRELTTCELSHALKIEPYAIASLESGHLILCCNETRKVYLYEPASCALTALAGSGDTGSMDGVDWSASFSEIQDMAVVENDRCAYLTDIEDCVVRRITLPASLFVNSLN